MAIYTGKGIVWNPDKNKPLHNFRDGPFVTIDDREQELMFKARYKADFEDELVIVEDDEPEATEEEVVKSIGVRELKKHCKDKGYEGYSNLNKEDLLKLISEKEGETIE